MKLDPSRLVSRMTSLFRGLFRRADIESEIAEEFRHHLDMRTRDLIDEGLSPEAARRRARLEFGHVESHREEARAARGLRAIDRLGFSWLDFKLAFRMLVRYPALTSIAVVAMAIAITFGAGFLEFTSQWASPRLPFDPEHRLVGITVRNSESRELEPRILHDFERWRDNLRSMDELGAFRLVRRNFDAGDGRRTPVQVTEISAAAFRLTETPALMGRTLVADDEREGARPVLVLGYDLWQDGFAGDVDVVGRSVRLGSVDATIVGVMPDGYEFPHSQSLWAPLRVDAVNYPVGDGPGIYVFGRLAPGVTIEQARAELAMGGLRVADARSDATAPLVSNVVPYPELVSQAVPGFFDPAFVYINLFILALALLFCANVALLLFARAASRESELVVRNALGAGRYRIVLQLFAEALVLGALAAIPGLFGARYGYEWFLTVAESSAGEQPFWYEAEISPMTAVYVVGLTLVGAGVAGVLPAMKITRGLAAGLRTTTAGGGGIHFGGIWTLIIVAQIAATVPLPALGYLAASELDDIEAARDNLVSGEYLTARVAAERELESSSLDATVARLPDVEADDAFLSRYDTSVGELEERLLAEAGISGVAWAEHLPTSRRPYHQVEMDEGGVAPPDETGHRVGRTEVVPGYFETLQAPILAGRAFDSEDVVSGARVVIVDEPFVERVLGGRNPLGLRLRYVAIERQPPPGPDSPWYEVVGVVGNLGVVTGYGLGGVYHPASRRALYPAGIVLRVASDPAGFAPTLRTVAASVDASLRVERVIPLDDLADAEASALIFFAIMIGVGTLTALMLSLAGTYSVMAFSVSRRTREIGVRVALGASRTRVLMATFRRPIMQVVCGVATGGALLLWAFDWVFGRPPTHTEYVLIGAHVVAVFVVTLLSCVVPTRRALGIEPREALNVEG